MKKNARISIEAFLIFVIALLLDINISNAELEIDIHDGTFDPFNVAITTFEGENEESNKYADKIRNTIINDLENSSLFRSISNDAFLEKPNVTTIPNFQSWKSINSELLLIGNVNVDVDTNKIEVRYKIWDPFKEIEVQRGSYKISIDGWRRISHKIANSVYKTLVGVSGYFDSRVVFVSEKGPELNKIKRLAIMDQDGHGFRFLTTGKDLVLSPRFDPKSQKIIYMSYKVRNQPPKVYILDLESGEQRVIGDIRGMSFAPRFSPDNDHAIISLAIGGTSNIYEIDLDTGEKIQLTNQKGFIDTSPDYSNDAKKIVFNSDRDFGRTHIYVMNRDGSDITKISGGDGSYRTPVWSPDGKWIAFTKILSGNFYIGIMKPDGSEEKLLTSSWLEESPSWAPNSNTIIFGRQKRDGKNQLYAIDISGHNERLIYSHTDGSQPSWSPYLN